MRAFVSSWRRDVAVISGDYYEFFKAHVDVHPDDTVARQEILHAGTGLLREYLDYHPDDRDARNELLDRIMSDLQYAVHHWPDYLVEWDEDTLLGMIQDARLLDDEGIYSPQLATVQRQVLSSMGATGLLISAKIEPEEENWF